MTTTQITIQNILTKALAPTIAKGLAAEIAAALPPQSDGADAGLRGALEALLGYGAPKRRGRPPGSSRARSAVEAAAPKRRGRPPKALAAPATPKRRGRPPKAAKAMPTRAARTATSKGDTNLVSLRAALRWARHRIVNKTASETDPALVVELEKKIAKLAGGASPPPAKAKKTTEPKAPRAKVAAAKPKVSASPRRAGARKAASAPNGAVPHGSIGAALSNALPA